MKTFHNKGLLALLLASALLLSLLVGCSSDSSGSDSSSNNSTADTSDTTADDTGGADAEADTIAFDAEENTIRFGITPGNIRVAVNILAKELGYYDEEGVNVEFVDIQDATAALTSISANKTELDVWGTGIAPSLTFIANGADLVIFEGTAAEGGSIISTPENVEYYKDLTNYGGITAAMVRGSSSWLITRPLLIELGVDVDSITLMEVDSQANVAQAVAKGEADLGFLPIEMANSYLDIGTAVVYETGELDPMYVCCRQVTSSTKLTEKHDAFVKYAIANLRALEYYENDDNQDAIVSTLAAQSGQTEDYVRNYLFVNRTFLTQDPNQSGVITFYQSLDDSGYFDGGTTVDVSDHIDISVYEEALAELLEREPDDEFFQEQLEIFRTYNDSNI
jgi:NitT/TauT family transport system substrate-binding protein